MKQGWILLGVVLAALLPAQPAAENLLEQLVNDSPFLPPAGSPRAAASNGEPPFELRGIIFEEGAYVFSVYNVAEGESSWVRLDESGHPFIAHHYDPERETLMLEYQGEALMLPLKESRVQAAEATSPSTPTPLPAPVTSGGPRRLPNPPTDPTGGPSGPVPSPAPGGPSAAPPLPANMDPAEARRMQEMADEIRRRRSLREMPAAPTAIPNGGR